MTRANPSRCPWCLGDPLYIRYHDEEWGVPLYEDLRLFEMLVLEGAQAGLSWITVLKKRENYRAAFHAFSPERIARYDQPDIDRLLGNPGIVRNRLKIESAIRNARAFLSTTSEFGSFSTYLWGFVDGIPIQNRWERLEDVPATTTQSDTMSRELKRRGFAFVGSTVCYALMQSVGMVNDHLLGCERYSAIKKLGRRRKSTP